MLIWSIWIIKAHDNRLLSPEDILLAGSEEYWTEEDHQNIKIADIAYPLLICGNMWYNTNILKIHPNGMAPFKKLLFKKGA